MMIKNGSTERRSERDTIHGNGGNAMAEYDLGMKYEKGEGVPQSYEEAAWHYRQAAEQGLPEAQFNLGLMYEKGEGVPQSYEVAGMWYGFAARQGYRPAMEILEEITAR